MGKYNYFLSHQRDPRAKTPLSSEQATPVLTTLFFRKVPSTGGRCAPFAQSASSTAFLRRSRAAILYRPALPHTETWHPGRRECFLLCDLSLALQNRKANEEMGRGMGMGRPSLRMRGIKKPRTRSHTWVTSVVLQTHMHTQTCTLLFGSHFFNTL